MFNDIFLDFPRCCPDGTTFLEAVFSPLYTLRNLPGMFFRSTFRRIDLSAFVECRKWQRMLTAIIVIIAVKNVVATLFGDILMVYCDVFRRLVQNKPLCEEQKGTVAEELEVHLKQYHAVPISDYIRLSTCICFRIVE